MVFLEEIRQLLYIYAFRNVKKKHKKHFFSFLDQYNEQNLSIFYISLKEIK